MFELESEYTRMGVPNNEWAAVNINSSYEICDTYVCYFYSFNLI